MDYEVVLHPLAEEDLEALDEFIGRDSPVRARAVTRRIKARCESLARFPERGVARNDLGEGVRLLLSERRLVIAYRLGPQRVTVLRIFAAGLDYERLLGDEGWEA